MKKQSPVLPVATSSASVDNLIGWLRAELKEMNCGTIGLTFTVHRKRVVKWNQMKEVVGKRVEAAP